MDTTGSRAFPLAVKMLLVGFLAAIAFGAFALHANDARAGGGLVVTVNSTANTDDEVCSGAPNLGTGNCTLREAINAVNGGIADEIHFHLPVFSETTPGVINLESGLGDLPTITREIVIDARGAGVIIDGDGEDDGIYCESAGLTSDGNDTAMGCDNGLEVHATHNNFSFVLLGGGGEHFTIQHIADGGTDVSQFGDGDGIFLCGGDPALLGCDVFSFGTVNIDGINITDIVGGSAQAIALFATNTADATLTNSSLSSDSSGLWSAATANTPFPNPTTPTLGPNSIVIDGNTINAMNDDAVFLQYNGNKDSDYLSSINAVITNNTFVGDTTAVRVLSNSTIADHGVYNIDINHNSDIHAVNGPGVEIDLNVFSFADFVDSNINISDNGDITGGIATAGTSDAGGSDAGIFCPTPTPDPSPLSLAGATPPPNTGASGSSDGGMAGGKCCPFGIKCCFLVPGLCCELINVAGPFNCDTPAIDVFVGFQHGDSHSSSTVTIDRNGDVTGSAEAIDSSNYVCCGAGNTAITEINDNGDLVGQGNNGITLNNYGYDDGGDVGDNGVSQVTISGNSSIEGQNGAGARVNAGAGNDSGNGDENTADTTVSDNGPIRGRNDAGLYLQNYAYAEGGIGNLNIATVHVSGNEAIQGDAGDGVYVDNESYSDNGYEGSNNTALTQITKNGDIVGSTDGVDVNYTFAGSWTDGPGDNNTSSTEIMDNGDISGIAGYGVYHETAAGTYDSGSGDGNVASGEISGNGDIDGGDNDGIDAYVYSGGDSGTSDENTAVNRVNGNGDITGESGDGVYLETQAGDYDQNEDSDGNNLTSEVIGNGAITGLSSDGVEVETDGGGGTVDSLDNHTTTRVNGNGAIVGEGNNGINLTYLENSWVCCDPADTNTVEVNNNTDGIVGQEGDGIVIYRICCSVNLVSIMDNTGDITGPTDNGLDYTVDGFDSSAGCACFTDIDGNGFPDAIEHSINSLAISGNTFADSENGMFIASGAFDAGMVSVPGVPKSVITGNTVTHNSENGIFLNTTQGINIGPDNTITDNGFATNTNVHAGIQIVNELADQWVAGAVYLPAGGNRITQNSIFDNANAFADDLGIDLNPDDGDPRVGCILKADPISPNNCQQPPVITLIAAGGIVGGTTCALCHVEVFLADPTPADQPMTVSAVQHGEGAQYLATGDADDAGNFTVQLPCGVTTGDITATTTNKTKDTSEFSENRPFLSTGPCATPTNTPVDTATPTSTSVPTTPPPATSTPTPVTTKACGDVNDNGSVDAVDAQLILQYSAGLVSTLLNLPSGDVNDSGDVNPVDSALILQVEAGLIPLGTLNCG